MLVLRYGAIVKKHFKKPLPNVLQVDALSDGNHFIISSKNMLGFASSIDTFYSTEEVEELKWEHQPCPTDTQTIKDSVDTRFPIDWYVVHIEDK